MKKYIVVYEYDCKDPFIHAHMQNEFDEQDGAVSDFVAKMLGHRVAEEEAGYQNAKLTSCRVYKQI